MEVQVVIFMKLMIYYYSVYVTKTFKFSNRYEYSLNPNPWTWLESREAAEEMALQVTFMIFTNICKYLQIFTNTYKYLQIPRDGFTGYF